LKQRRWNPHRAKKTAESVSPRKDGMKMGKKDKAKNMAQIAKGKLKETAGKATGDQQLESEGDVDQMSGNVKQAGEKVKDAFTK
jgi:uncharacterized protein YjbJ (UPF0337 family)